MTGSQIAIALIIALLIMTFYQVLKLAADQRRRHAEVMTTVRDSDEALRQS